MYFLYNDGIYNYTRFQSVVVWYNVIQYYIACLGFLPCTYMIHPISRPYSVNAQNPLVTFPRNFPVDGEVANFVGNKSL